MALGDTEGSSRCLTLASGGLQPSRGRRQSGTGLALAGARAGAVRGAGAELLEAGSAAALLSAPGLCRHVVVAAVVTEDATAYPGDQASMGCEDSAVGLVPSAQHRRGALGWVLDTTWLSSHLALPPTFECGHKAHLIRCQ